VRMCLRAVIFGAVALRKVEVINGVMIAMGWRYKIVGIDANDDVSFKVRSASKNKYSRDAGNIVILIDGIELGIELDLDYSSRSIASRRCGA